MKQFYNKKINGFTLIEIIISMTIITIIAGLMVGILSVITQVNQRESSSTEVTGQLNFVMQTIQRLIRESSNIETQASISTSTLKLRMKDLTKDPTCISLESGVIKLAEGPNASNPQNCTSNITDLTNDRVIVDTLNFKKFTQYPGHDTVSIDLAISFNTSNPKSQVQHTLKSAIARVSAATFDSDVLPGGTYNYNLGQVSSPWQKIIMADGSAANPSYTFGNNTGLGLFRAGTNILGFSSNSSERMRIDANGNVGIGTVSPTSKLNLQDSTAASITQANLYLENIKNTGGFTTIYKTIKPTIAETAANLRTASYWNTYLTGGNNDSGVIDIGTLNAAGNAYDSILTLYGKNGGTSKSVFSGNVGIGTTNPLATLDVKNASTTQYARVAILANGIGDTTFVLNTRKGETTNLNGDIFSKLGLDYGTTQNAGINFHRGGSTTGGFLSFYVNNGTEKVRIDASGYVGIGVVPTKLLDICLGCAGSYPAGDGGTALTVRSSGAGTGNYAAMSILSGTAGYASLYLGDTGAENRGGIKYDNSGEKLYLTSAGALAMAISSTGAVRMYAYGAGTATFDASGNITSVSDERLKNIQGNFNYGLKEILQINPILYKWNEKSGLETEHTYAGFSAQEVQKLIPEAVGEDQMGYLTLSDRPVIAAVVNAIKELNKTVDELKAENNTLKARVDALEAKINSGQ